ncbi:Lrp/AsnC family transcriptional regulator [Candidatus Micrarchaeota archaeon]|nr:Lrp/AsnC family transcriptional regulator [Candidatus Micrarchaeota archaeon]
MDAVDLELLYHLDIDSRKPIKRIAARIGEHSEKINYRLNRLIREGVIKRCYAEVNPWKVGYSSFKVYLQFQSVDKQKIDEMFAYLCNECNVSWAVSCLGRWDMIIEVLAKDRHEFYAIYSRFHKRFSERILCKEIGVTLEMTFLNKKWLCPERPAVSISAMTGTPERLTDEKDLAILRRLTKNCREPVKSMAAGLGLPPTTVSQRIRNMSKKSVIPAFRTDLDLDKFGRVYCKSFVYLSGAGEDEIAKMLEHCIHHPDVTFLTRCIAAWDFEIEAHSPSFSDFTAMMNDLRDRFPRVVRNFEAVVISRETSMFSVLRFSERRT